MSVSQSLYLTEHTVNREANTSKVQFLWYSTQTGDSWNGYERTAKYYVSINGGAETEYSVKYTLPKNATKIIVDTDITVTHKSDGSGTIKVRTWMDTDISAGVVEQEKTLTLTVIPRETTIDALACNTSYFTGTITYKYTPKSASYYNKCFISNGNVIVVKTINLGQKSASQQTGTVTLSDSELSDIYKKLTNTKKGTLRVTIQTYSDSNYSTQIGSAKYKEISLSIPSDISLLPTATVTFSPVSDAPLDNSNLYVSGFSKVKASFTNVSPKYGASIVSYKLTVYEKDYYSYDPDESSITSGKLTTSGDLTFKVVLTDSRGFSQTYQETKTVHKYSQPKVTLLSSSKYLLTDVITYQIVPSNSVFYTRVETTYNGEVISYGNIGQIQDAALNRNIGFTETDLSSLYNKLPNKDRCTLSFTVKSYVDSAYTKQIGEAGYKEEIFYIPDNSDTKPTATMTLTPVSVLPTAPLNQFNIKGKTQLRVTLDNLKGKYGASIVSSSVSVLGKSGTSPYTSDLLLTSGKVTATGTVTDSRGFSRTYTQEITVIDYSAPQILPASSESEVIVARCDTEGNLSDTGTYLKIKAKRSYSKVIANLEQRNFCAIQYRYKESTGSYSSWTTILDKNAESDEIDSDALLNGTLKIDSSYFVQIRAIDDVGESVIYATTISTEKVYMHRAGSMNSFALGKYAEKENTFDVAEDITAIFRGKVNFPGEAWLPLELYTSVARSETNVGRYGGSGAYYRVCTGEKRICVIFNVSFTTSSSTVRVVDRYKSGTSEFQIPAAYRPSYDVYALCPVGFADDSRGIATVSVAPSGRVNIYAVHKLPGATLSTGETVEWIDGYIDFWT